MVSPWGMVAPQVEQVVPFTLGHVPPCGIVAPQVEHSVPFALAAYLAIMQEIIASDPQARPDRQLLLDIRDNYETGGAWPKE